MTAELANPNVLSNGDVHQLMNNKKKSRESEKRRRRRKPKKKNHSNSSSLSRTETEDDESDDAKENSDPQQPLDHVEVEYIPEKADLEDNLLEDFKKVFEKFNFSDSAGVGLEENDKKDGAAQTAISNKKADSDSEEEEQDVQQKEKGVSNKKKKLQRRMKIAELKQICSRPDVVEVWDATAADPKLLVFLKSYRNTVPVPRHWSQKRKFLQGTGCNTHGARTCGVY